MRIIVIGGVATGTKAAAKLKRHDRSAQVDVYTKSRDIFYAGCGLPYYVGGEIGAREELIVNSPEKFFAITGANIHTGQEAVKLDPSAKTVTFRDTESGSEYTESCDKLIMASGASPVIPPIEGINLSGVFTVRIPDDAIAIREYIKKIAAEKLLLQERASSEWKWLKTLWRRSFPLPLRI
ncbi:MAG: FAD-dependent oxidoreductase [Ruminiclostridium sp.]